MVYHIYHGYYTPQYKLNNMVFFHCSHVLIAHLCWMFLVIRSKHLPQRMIFHGDESHDRK